MQKPINLVWDGNYLFHSCLSVFEGFSKKPKKGETAKAEPKVKVLLNSEEDRAVFMRSVATQFCYAVNNLPAGGRVIFCADSKSWRKAIMLNESAYSKTETYKGSRDEGKATKDYTHFYKCLEEFGAILESHNIIFSKVDGAEGDDLVFKWCRYFNSIGENAVAVTADRDEIQVVEGTTSPFTIMWNNNSNLGKIYAVEGWEKEWLKDVPNDIFSFGKSADKDTLAKMIKQLNIKIEVVDPRHLSFVKVLTGDGGDDVPSVHYTPKKKTPKNPNGEGFDRVAEGKAEKIIELYKTLSNNVPLEILFTDDEEKDRLAGIILRVCGSIDGKEERKKVIEKFDRNCRLVWLNDMIFPEYVLTGMNQHILEIMSDKSKGFLKNNKIDRIKLMAGTKYEKNVAPKSFSANIGFDLPEL